tara:strand:+ start:101 stop:268 length:168 start_codon:yes stop_codon:yes gene_type:complete
MVLLVIILGLLGGDELAYLNYVTTQNIGNFIIISGVVVFLAKLCFWYWDKKQKKI